MPAFRRSPSAPSPRWTPTPIRRPTSSRASTPASRSAPSSKGLWVDFKAAGLSNYSKINPLALAIDGLPQNLPYRGSQVLLAYDTTKLAPADVPKTFADLIAWIKANPGQFIYNRPNKGGSGGNFVRRAIYEANGKDPTQVQGRQLHRRSRRPRRSTRPGRCSTTSPRR